MVAPSANPTCNNTAGPKTALVTVKSISSKHRETIAGVAVVAANSIVFVSL